MSTFRGLPDQLKPYADKPCWAVWRGEPKKDGRISKPPTQPKNPRKYAKLDDPSHWTDFATADAVRVRDGFDGVGFNVALAGDLAPFDIDGCIDANGKLEPAAERLIKRANTYVEKSPSGKGLHIIGTGSGGYEYMQPIAVPGANGI